MRKHGVKKLHIYITAISLLLSGCHFQNPSINSEVENTVVDQQIVEQIESLEEQLRILRESMLNTEENFSVIESNAVEGTYFEKDYGTTVDYDSMILTMEERGIGPLSESAKALIKEISFVNKSRFNSSWIDLFEIDSFYLDAYMNSNVSSNPKTHQGSEFYNQSKDSICWDQLVKVIVQNSSSTASKNPNKESLSVAEIKIILKQLEAFSMDIKKDYPEFDMEHLACQLSTLSLVYGTSKVNGTLASTSAYSIEWFLNSNGDYPVLQTSIGLNEHEFKHFLCEHCIDEAKDICYVVPSGVNYGNYDALKFTFIEEATAEEYSSSRNNTKPVTYFDKIEILDNLRLVLSMQDDYEEDAFFKYSLFRNPLATVQQFPVMNDQMYFFSNNLKMLASYNACLDNIDTKFTRKVCEVFGYGDFFSNIEKQREVYSSLLNYAQVELSRLFFTDLVIMNEEKNISLEYNFYLMRLFEKRSKLAFDVVSSKRGIEISSANFEGLNREREMTMLRYLSDRFQISLKDLKELYDEYALSDGITFPSFVDNNRINFYRELETEEYDATKLTYWTISNLQYYIQYASK